MNEESLKILEKLRHLKPHLTSKMGVKRLRVYGSVARGEATQNSDVDLIADFESPPGLFKLFDIQYYLEDKIGRKIDFSQPQSLHKALKDIILSEAQDV